MPEHREFDWPRLEALAARAIEGDRAAHHDLVWSLWPEWERLIGSSSAMGRYARSEDHVRNVATRLVEKVGARKNLSGYFDWRARNPDKGFDDWIRIVTTNAARDYVRATLREPTERSDLDRTVLMNDFAAAPVPERAKIRPPITAAQTARELLEFAAARLEPTQLAALERWLEGSDFDEIASDLSLDSAEAAKRVLRASIATLRRAFAAG
jgi:DNA-directed RNA polymerase specialized sigma24 family protein